MKETTVFEHFNSLESLVSAIQTRKENEVYKGAELASKEGTQTFTATRNFNHSIELIEKGYHEPLDKLKKGIEKTMKTATATRRRQTVGIVGYAPHVPNAIIGIPQSMIRTERIIEKKKTIHLVYGFSATGNISADKLIKGGILFLSMVNQLELDGYRVKIDLLRCTTSSVKHAIGFTVNVKEYSQPLNLLKLCYPLVNPSMLRRTAFRWCETLPDLERNGNTEAYRNQYGQSLIVRMGYDQYDDRKERDKACQKELDLLKRNGIIKDGQYYLNVYQCFNDAETVDELKKIIGL